MFKKVFATVTVAFVLGLSLCLFGCSAPDATGYMGQLEDGKSLVYIELGDTVLASLADDENQGDDADVYEGKATTDDAGKTTITDKKSGKSLTLTMTENSDGTFDVYVDGHGKGTLKPYEGNILEVVSAMADDDESSESSESSK